MTVSDLLEQSCYKSDNINKLACKRYTRKNAQVVTNLQQTCSNAVPTTCQQDVFASCYKLATNLLRTHLVDKL